ncbi:MYXO-CTERM sorting domain-containing protein [Polyangium sp. 15x6]|uniref:MYXO-CTERM sorting domain-containing protein n=1 Tax=Polyangium sp. 15x6 TaxID=3042687 RepID=UPI00249CA03E|nr:MYXO-CTERM sorting domain-containing protein [Polyangium sp. 15x6]MDI3286345.1 kelch repeat-containing protein [Polyangium sp. 15x6]
MLAARAQHTATLLPTGYILFVGGAGASNAALATAELYSLHLDDFMGTVSMSVPRYRQTATLLQDGRVLVAGGGSGVGVDTLLYTGPAPSACASADHCPTGFCVDGYCCDSACGDGATDDCQACNVPGALGQCTLLSAGTECRAATGTCDAPEVCSGDVGACPADGAAPDGTTCDDDNVCTQADACQSGLCTGSPLICVAPDECHEASACDPKMGCGSAPKPDGTPCSLGTCQAGVCLGNGGGGSGGGDGGAGDEGGEPPAGGCGTSGSPTGHAGWLVLAALLLLRRRPRA